MATDVLTVKTKNIVWSAPITSIISAITGGDSNSTIKAGKGIYIQPKISLKPTIEKATMSLGDNAQIIYIGGFVLAVVLLIVVIKR